MSDVKPAIKLADSSAGCIVLSLVPDDEQVALVLNKRSPENKTVPKEYLKKRYYQEMLMEERENDAIVRFIQSDGWGSPFGKEEDEDGKDRVKTAMRETLEETGSSVDGRIIPSVSYKEQPDPWSPYFNIVYLANGVGFSFQKDKMQDTLVDSHYSSMWKLRKLPIPRRHRKDNDRKKGRKITPMDKGIGIYQAALRRIIAILIQLNSGCILAELGRPGAENAEDLVRIVVGQIPYRNFFSHRMLKMLSGFNRMDIALNRLKDGKEGTIHNEELAAQIGANLILWLPYKPEDPESLLNQALKILIDRCDSRIRSGIGSFLVDRMERKEKAYLVSLDKKIGLKESDEKLVVMEEDDEPREGDEPEERPELRSEIKDQIARNRQLAVAIREKADD